MRQHPEGSREYRLLETVRRAAAMCLGRGNIPPEISFDAIAIETLLHLLSTRAQYESKPDAEFFKLMYVVAGNKTAEIAKRAFAQDNQRKREITQLIELEDNESGNPTLNTRAHILLLSCRAGT